MEYSTTISSPENNDIPLNTIQTTLHEKINSSLQSAIAKLKFRNSFTKKISPTGWISFNAPCCHHTGESKPDSRGRGGLLFHEHGGFSYHCFNCGYTTTWNPKTPLPEKAIKLFKWFGIPQEQIKLFSFLSWLEAKNNQNTNIQEEPTNTIPKTFYYESNIHESIIEKYFQTNSIKILDFPSNYMSLQKTLETSNPDILSNKVFLKIMKYLESRKILDYLDLSKIYWDISGKTPELIFPIQYFNKRKNTYDYYGWVTRNTESGKNRSFVSYLDGNRVPYNLEVLCKKDRKYLLLFEGIMDALLLDGIAFMSNIPNTTIIDFINAFPYEKILVPDRDNAGKELIKIALKHDWWVATPDEKIWQPGIKDAADAMAAYGKAYCIESIFSTKTKNPLTISLFMEKFAKFKQ